MPKSLRRRRHKALTSVLRATRLDTVEFFDVADALGVDPVVLFTRIAKW